MKTLDFFRNATTIYSHRDMATGLFLSLKQVESNQVEVLPATLKLVIIVRGRSIHLASITYSALV